MRSAGTADLAGGLNGIAGSRCRERLSQERLGFDRCVAADGQLPGERRKAIFAGEIEADRIRPRGTEEVTRQDDGGMRAADRRHRGGFIGRIGDQRLDRDGRVGDAVDEGGIGAVLEQAPNQIGQQRLVRADRRIDPTGAVQLVVADHLLIKRLAHAVQALELVLAGREVARHGVDRGERPGIVGSELRVDLGGCAEQLSGTGEVGQIRIELARVDRIAFEPIHLSSLDLTVPIGTLDQADHEPVSRPDRETIKTSMTAGARLP